MSWNRALQQIWHAEGDWNFCSRPICMHNSKCKICMQYTQGHGCCKSLVLHLERQNCCGTWTSSTSLGVLGTRWGQPFYAQRSFLSSTSVKINCQTILLRMSLRLTTLWELTEMFYYSGVRVPCSWSTNDSFFDGILEFCFFNEKQNNIFWQLCPRIMWLQRLSEEEK